MSAESLCAYCGDCHFNDDSSFCSSYCRLIHERTDRREISLSDELYDHVRAFALDTGQSAHALIERAINRMLDAAEKRLERGRK